MSMPVANLMARVEGYGGLSKNQEDLLRLGYCFKSLATVTLFTNANPLTFKARAAQKAEGNVLASTSLKMVKDKFTFTPKRRTDGMVQYTLQYAPNAKVTAKAEAKTTEKAGAKSTEITVSTEYRKYNYAVKVAGVHPNPALKLTGTWRKNSHGLGFDGKFLLSTSRFVNYNFATWYESVGQSIVLKHNGSDANKYALGELVLSYYRAVASTVKDGAPTVKDQAPTTHIAGLAKFHIPSKSTYLEFGGDYKWSDSTTLRGKVNSAGLVGLGLTRKILASLNLTLGAQFDTTKLRTDSISGYKFGFKLDFNSVF